MWLCAHVMLCVPGFDKWSCHPSEPGIWPTPRRGSGSWSTSCCHEKWQIHLRDAAFPTLLNGKMLNERMVGVWVFGFLGSGLWAMGSLVREFWVGKKRKWLACTWATATAALTSDNPQLVPLGPPKRRGNAWKIAFWVQILISAAATATYKGWSNITSSNIATSNITQRKCNCYICTIVPLQFSPNKSFPKIFVILKKMSNEF